MVANGKYGRIYYPTKVPNQVSQLPHITKVSNQMSMWVTKLPPHAFPPLFLYSMVNVQQFLDDEWCPIYIALGSTLKSKNRQVVSAENVTFTK